MLKAEIPISNTITLNQISESDVLDLVEQIGSKEVSDNVLMVPHPYQLSDGVSWIKHVAERREQLGKYTDWSIRKNGMLIGGIGLHNAYPEDKTRDEVGYWLGREHWGQGIMTLVLSSFTDLVFVNTTIRRLDAPVFDFNKASQRVLEKCGFKKQEFLECQYKKNGTKIDAILYSKFSLLE